MANFQNRCENPRQKLINYCSPLRIWGLPRSPSSLSLSLELQAHLFAKDFDFIILFRNSSLTKLRYPKSSSLNSVYNLIPSTATAPTTEKPKRDIYGNHLSSKVVPHGWGSARCAVCLSVNQGHNEPPFILFTPSPPGEKTMPVVVSGTGAGRRQRKSTHWQQIFQLCLPAVYLWDNSGSGGVVFALNPRRGQLRCFLVDLMLFTNCWPLFIVLSCFLANILPMSEW